MYQICSSNCYRLGEAEGEAGEAGEAEGEAEGNKEGVFRIRVVEEEDLAVAAAA